MKRVGDVLSSIFDENMMRKARGYSALFSCWQDMAEKNGIAAAADHSWIQSLEKGMVWIEVDHPGWKQILQTKESKLLSDFRRRFPDMDISGLSIMLCRNGSRPESAVSYENDDVSTESEYVAEPSPSTEEGYNAIKDNALKEVLMRLEQNIAAKEAAGAVR